MGLIHIIIAVVQIMLKALDDHTSAIADGSKTPQPRPVISDDRSFYLRSKWRATLILLGLNLLAFLVLGLVLYFQQ